jgi:membrane-anchored protein YejM (alkaline phosphatase superfamily)
MMNLFSQFALALFATMGFAVIFRVPARHIPACVVVGALGWVTYLITDYNIDSPAIACFFGACMVGLCSAVSAHIFKEAAKYLAGVDKTKSFFMWIDCFDPHEPWDAPLKKLDQPIPNAFYYLDTCIGPFIDRLKQLPQWDNLLIIFLPDHSIDYGPYTEALQVRNKIPMVWAGGAVKAPRKITQLCNQTDLAATLLAQLRLPHDQFRWSRDVLSASYRYPFAVHNYNNGFSLTDSTGFVAYDLESNRLVTNESSQAERLVRMGKAILQATTADLKAMGTK